MNKKIAELWTKHEGWFAPVAMSAFLVAGVQIGDSLATARLSATHIQEIKELQDKITDKDARIRMYNDKMGSDQTNLVEAVRGAAASAAKSAEAAGQAATAAATAATAAQTKESKP